MSDRLDVVEQGMLWKIPERFNVGSAVLENDGSLPALVSVDVNGGVAKYTFHDLRRFSSMVANGLRDYGVGRGDRVVLHLLQGVELVGCLLAVYRLAAIAVTVPALLGSEAVEYRVKDSGA
ncbi:MAG: AMP-binding protein, partial [Candidatus Caldarchaeum sp.]